MIYLHKLVGTLCYIHYTQDDNVNKDVHFNFKAHYITIIIIFGYKLLLQIH